MLPSVLCAAGICGTAQGFPSATKPAGTDAPLDCAPIAPASRCAGFFTLEFQPTPSSPILLLLHDLKCNHSATCPALWPPLCFSKVRRASRQRRLRSPIDGGRAPTRDNTRASRRRLPGLQLLRPRFQMRQPFFAKQNLATLT